MQLLDSVIDRGIGLLAGARGARAFHPAGVVCTGYATIGDRRLPLQSGSTRLRLSKGLGTPAGLPDIVGVALRLPTLRAGPDGRPGRWDVLMAGHLVRLGPAALVVPVRHWSHVRVSSLNRFDYDAARWTITGQLLIPSAGSGLSITGLQSAIASGGGTLALRAARDDAPSALIGIVNFSLDGSADVAFDPIDGTPPDVRLASGWLADVRRRAYAASRRARGA